VRPCDRPSCSDEATTQITWTTGSGQRGYVRFCPTHVEETRLPRGTARIDIALPPRRMAPPFEQE